MEKWVSEEHLGLPGGTLEKGRQGFLSALCLFADVSCIPKVHGRVLGLGNLHLKKEGTGFLDWLPLG